MAISLPARAARFSVSIGAALAVVGTLHQIVNLRVLRVPPSAPPPVQEPVSILVPMRNEAHRIAPTIASLIAQTGLADVEILVLDDGSTDGSSAVVLRAAAGVPHVRVLRGTPPPPGHLGKPNACAQLSAAARGDLLVFVDADVVLAPHAIAAAAALLRGPEPLDLLCPWPRQLAHGTAARLVQPLQAWSWMVSLPLRRAERSASPAMVAANGQFLLVDARALERSGGWAAVAGEVLDDIGLARAVRRHGGRTGVADGSAIASCLMYENWPELHSGYRKSLWSAFGSAAGSAAVAALLALVYLVPPAAGLRGSRIGMLGYVAAVAGRVLAARRMGGRVWPDALAHPLSVAVLIGLLASSWKGRLHGTLTWKDRRV
jgi:cellulose synthase/poly-beta-1,6-N-acetylglucosamine synthase-like glycosyltransferase